MGLLVSKVYLALPTRKPFLHKRAIFAFKVLFVMGFGLRGLGSFLFFLSKE